MTLLKRTEKLTKEKSVVLLLGVITKQKREIFKLKKKCSGQADELNSRTADNIIAKREDIKDSSDRFFDVKIVTASTSKITFNPMTGRISLKVSNKSSDNVREKFIEMVKTIKESDRDFAPFTYRGSVRYVEKSGTYRACLQTTNKLFKAQWFEIY